MFIQAVWSRFRPISAPFQGLQNVKKDSETSTLTPTTSSTDPIPEATSLRTESRLKSKGKKPKMRCMGPVDGLGYVPSTGLFNQLISFLGLVIYARQQKQGIDQSTLRLFSSCLATIFFQQRFGLLMFT